MNPTSGNIRTETAVGTCLRGSRSVVEDMRTALSFVGRFAGLAALLACAAQAAELPPVETLQRQMRFPAETVSVYEPHLSVGDRHVTIEYVGYRVLDVLERIFGENWRSQVATIEFRALDGYVSRIDVGRFLKDSAYIVFSRKDGKPFTVDNIEQNQTGVPLGPYLSRLGQHLPSGPAGGGCAKLALSGEGSSSRHPVRRGADASGSWRSLP